MHTSIAHALYRGAMRMFQPRLQVAAARLERASFRYGRNAWLKGRLNLVLADPSFVPIARYREMENKHETIILVGFTHPSAVPEINAWRGAAFILRTKTCTATRNDMPIRVAHHTVLRLMERADIASVNQALTWLLPAFNYVNLLEPRPPEEDVLLPCLAGGVIGHQDKDDPTVWFFVTYIDEDKLRPEQRAELAERKRRLAETLPTYGITPLPLDQAMLA